MAGELEKAVDGVLDGMVQAAAAFKPELRAEEIGRVRFVGQGIVRADGLGGVKAEELVLLGAGVAGMALDILPDSVGIVLLGAGEGLKAGDTVQRTGRVLDVPVGSALIGRVIDPLGRPLDGREAPAETDRWPVQQEAPEIIRRAPVEKPLQTGLKVIDALIPIGRGQRELILGDRQTGKTAIALDTIINQKGEDVVCVYCAIGQRSAGIAKAVDVLARHDAMAHSIVVVVEGDDPPGLQFVAPYAATTIAEYFMRQGRDALIVYDDLTRHALAYRQLSLLLRRPPGREAFPGDIFYIHSRLLERATRLKPAAGGGSLTAIPIVETEAQNISAYIPTNLISITDGQIYLSPELFQRGILPAVDVGLSVSRVGGRAQQPAYREVAGDLRLSYSQFQELEAFARFGTRLDEATRQTLVHGRRIRAVLLQDRFAALTPAEQVMVLLAATRRLLDPVALEQVEAAQAALVEAIRRRPDVAETLLQAGAEAQRLEAVLAVARDVIAPFVDEAAPAGGAPGKVDDGEE